MTINTAGVNVNFVSASELVKPVPTGAVLLRERGTWLKTPAKPAPVLNEDGTVNEAATELLLATYESVSDHKPVAVTVASYQVVDHTKLDREASRVDRAERFKRKTTLAGVVDTELSVVGAVHYDPATRSQLVKVEGEWHPVADFINTIYRYRNGKWVPTTLAEIG